MESEGAFSRDNITSNIAVTVSSRAASPSRGECSANISSPAITMAGVISISASFAMRRFSSESLKVRDLILRPTATESIFGQTGFPSL